MQKLDDERGGVMIYYMELPIVTYTGELGTNEYATMETQVQLIQVPIWVPDDCFAVTHIQGHDKQREAPNDR